MMTAPTMTIHVTSDKQAAAEIGAQVSRMVRQLRPAPAPRPKLPYEHDQLFREPVYTDGQPYARDEDHHETA
jgi:hypothetical protein